jgi:peptide deformylase
VRWEDADRNEHDEWIEGYLARVMQHEFDHLDGKMFIDRITPLRKTMIKNKLKSLMLGKYCCGYRTKPVRK